MNKFTTWLQNTWISRPFSLPNADLSYYAQFSVMHTASWNFASSGLTVCTFGACSWVGVCCCCCRCWLRCRQQCTPMQKQRTDYTQPLSQTACAPHIDQGNSSNSSACTTLMASQLLKETCHNSNFRSTRPSSETQICNLSRYQFQVTSHISAKQVYCNKNRKNQK